MGAIRQSRTARPDFADEIKLQERDRWIFESLGKMECLSTAQLAVLHFGSSIWAAQKRLVRLHRAGYIRAWVPDGNLAVPNVYTLDRRGASALGAVAGERRRVPKGLDRQLGHRLLINETRIRLALSLEEIEGELGFWKSDRELSGLGPDPVVPDALFSIRWPEGVRQYALEIEREARSAERFLRKIFRYQALSNLYGAGELVVLAVAGSERWLRRYRSALVRARIEFPAFFALPEALAANPLGAVWLGLVNDEPMSLRTLRCRTEGEVSRSA